MDIRKIGIIGAGTMGQGVAFQFAKYGYGCVLVDLSEEKLNHARREIRNISRHDMLFSKPEKPVDVFQNIEFSTEPGDLSTTDYIIENITENIALKESLYGQLREIVNRETRIAVNTSAISITRIGSLMPWPENVLGIHFMNPVHRKSTVEVIKGHHTSEETLRLSLGLLADVTIKGVVVNDFPGFISNRVLMLTINEAIFALQDGVASVSDIDRIFKECFSHKMGPLETGDLIGLDTIYYTLEVLFDAYKDSKFRPAPLLKKMVDAGLHGRKTGEGFYKY